MGCGCSKGAGANVEYELRTPGSPISRYGTIGEARAALTSAGNPAGSTIKAVAK